MKIEKALWLNLLVFIVILIWILISCNKEEVPVLTTAEVNNITATTASCGGNIIDDGGSEVLSRGVCWSTSTKPTITDYKTDDASGTGSYTSKLNGLSPFTIYFVRAYATNSSGTGYGEPVPFITPERTSKADILTSKPWRLFSSTYNGITEILDDCQKDDYSLFKSNGILEQNPGSIKCYSGETLETYSWSLSSDENYLTVDDITYTIIELSESVLIIKYIEDSDSMVAIFIPM
jgi:hypothetical protein